MSGVPGEQLKRVAKMFATQKPSTLIWCMGQTQHTVGTANVRASCIALLLTGNVGGPGTGANIFRGHDNVQGATDVGLDIVTLPFYYGLVEGAWKHWSRVWEVDYNYLVGRFDDKKIMETPGIPLTRWFDAVILPKDQVAQKDNVKAMFVQGHASNSITRIPESLKGLQGARTAGRRRSASDDLGLARGQRRPQGQHVSAAGRDPVRMQGLARRLQPRDAVGRADRQADLRDRRTISRSCISMAKKLGFADQMFKNIKVENNLPVAEDILREMNRGSFSTGYCGQSPERLKSHMAHQADFDMLTQRATTGPNKGDYYGLPWPCWGTPEVKHPGTPLLYNTNLAVMDGGGCFRARFGVEREEKRPDGTTVKVNLLAEGSYSKDSEIKDGYPEFTLGVLKKLGWDKDLTEAEMAVINKINPTTPDAVSWSIDLSGGIQRVALKHGCVPYGNAKARMNAFGLPDPIPVHREPIYTPRVDLVAKYPTLPDAKQFRLPNIGFTVQKAAVDKGIAKQFPLILSSGRLVEYEGGGEETRSNKWLAELQQTMFIEINPADAADRGIKDGGWVWVTGAENGSKAKVKALVTERVGKGVAWMPFHFGGWFGGQDLRANYPAGTDPIVLGESANTITTYGYDPATGMQEPKVTLCQIPAA